MSNLADCTSFQDYSIRLERMAARAETRWELRYEDLAFVGSPEGRESAGFFVTFAVSFLEGQTPGPAAKLLGLLRAFFAQLELADSKGLRELLWAENQPTPLAQRLLSALLARLNPEIGTDLVDPAGRVEVLELLLVWLFLEEKHARKFSQPNPLLILCPLLPEFEPAVRSVASEAAEPNHQDAAPLKKRSANLALAVFLFLFRLEGDEQMVLGPNINTQNSPSQNETDGSSAKNEPHDPSPSNETPNSRSQNEPHDISPMSQTANHPFSKSTQNSVPGESPSSSTTQSTSHPVLYFPSHFAKLYRESLGSSSTLKHSISDPAFISRLWVHAISGFSGLDFEGEGRSAEPSLLFLLWLELSFPATISVAQQDGLNPFIPLIRTLDRFSFRRSQIVLYFSLCALLRLSSSDSFGRRLFEPIDPEIQFETLPVMSGSVLDFLLTLLLALSEIFISAGDPRTAESAVLSILLNWSAHQRSVLQPTQRPHCLFYL